MKIAFVWTGFTSYMADCWRALAATPGVELKVWIEEVCTGGVAYRPDDIMRGLDYTWRHTDEIDAPSCAAIEAEVSAFAPDALFICGWARKWPPYLAASERLERIPKVLCCDMPWEWKLRKFVARFVLAHRLRRFRKIMVPGRAAARYARWLGFAEEDVVCGEYAIDVGRFRGCGNEMWECGNVGMRKWGSVGMRKWGSAGMSECAGEGRAGFLFVGRKVPEKGLDVLERAAGIYRAAGGSWAVDVPDFVEPKEVPRVMREHACLVLPSRWEPWGVVVVEALAAGMRVIVSGKVGARLDLPVDEVFRQGDAAALAQAMLRVEKLGERDEPVEGIEEYGCQSWAKRVVALTREFGIEK